MTMQFDHVPYHDDDVVDPIAEAAKASNLSIATFRREIKKADGPVVTRLSARRIGVTRRHRREWLARRSNLAGVGNAASRDGR